jgi:FAD/FMN-containing dehydrogenase
MVMLVQFSGDDEAELIRHVVDLKQAVADFAKAHAGIQIRLLKDAEEAEKYWTIRRQSFALLHGAIKGKDTAPFIDDFIVKPEYVKEVLPKVNAILDQYKKDLIYTIAGHPGNGNFHIIPLMDLKDPRIRALIPEISEKIYQLIFQYHGSFTAEHNDGLIRTPYLEEMYGSAIEKLFVDTKKIFDPSNMFNPGKKVGGNLAYSTDHIAPTR